MRTTHLRSRLTLIVVVFGAVLGMACGFLLFRTITTRLAMIELDHHAWRYMLRAEGSSQASENFLHSMAAARLSPCSEAEIAYMHHLLFQSEFLKDGGRMSDGRVQCDALFGPSELTKRAFTPTFRLKDGTRVYTDVRMVPGDPEPRVGVERGGFFVSFLHWRPDRLGNLPLKFTLTEVDDTDRKPGWLHGEPTPTAAAVLAKDGWARLDDRLFVTHCSPHYFNCFTAFVDRPAVFASKRTSCIWSIAFGGTMGGFIGFFCLLLFQRNQSMVYQLRRAIRDDKLRMVYQPLVDLKERRIVGAEALIRWTDDQGIAVRPDVFVPEAEAIGCIGELTALAVRHVLRDFGDLLRERPEFRVSVNVTATDLVDPAFLPMLERSLANARVPASSLTLEVTEGSTAQKHTAVETIHRLRERGHSVHIDDFGTGYSSLSYLHSLAVDAIKIDKSFTHAIGTEAVTLSILPQIMSMAEALNLQVVAEGIETEEQAAYFRLYDQPILGQGWLFGRPVDAVSFRILLAQGDVGDSALLSPETVA